MRNVGTLSVNTALLGTDLSTVYPHCVGTPSSKYTGRLDVPALRIALEVIVLISPYYFPGSTAATFSLIQVFYMKKAPDSARCKKSYDTADYDARNILCSDFTFSLSDEK